MKPYNIYTLDITIRIIYLLISFIFCTFIFFQFIEVILLFEVSPVIFYTMSKRFIVTQITQLFTTVWFFCTTLSFIFIFPLTVYHIKCFFVSSWYYYQVQLYVKISIQFLAVFFLIYTLSHLYLVSYLIDFFLYWEVDDEYSLLRIEAEISLFLYVLWLFLIKFSISLIFTLVTIISFLCYSLIYIKYLYLFMLLKKKIFIFIITFLVILLIPPDFLIQLIVTAFIFCLIEFFLFAICFKLFYIFKLLNTTLNANVKTNIKNFP